MIVNPATIYWINTLNTLKNAALVAAILAPLILILRMMSIDNMCDLSEEETNKQNKKALITGFILELIFILMIIFIPSKETSTEMLVAKMITPENLHWGKDAILDFIKEIVAIIKGN